MTAHSRNDLARRIEDLPTKSAKIRELGRAGLSRSEIAKFLGLRYQHVRNVLVADEQKADRAPPEPVHVKIDESGRVLLPAAFRACLGVKPGDTLVLTEENGTLRLATLEQSLKEAQALIRKYIPDTNGILDDFIAQRRNEAERE